MTVKGDGGGDPGDVVAVEKNDEEIEISENDAWSISVFLPPQSSSLVPSSHRVRIPEPTAVGRYVTIDLQNIVHAIIYLNSDLINNCNKQNPWSKLYD